MNEHTTCKACGARIRFVRTRTGQLMPLDPEPVEDGNVRIGDDGRAEVLGKAARQGLTGLYRSHFASCFAAGSFRRKGG